MPLTRIVVALSLGLVAHVSCSTVSDIFGAANDAEKAVKQEASNALAAPSTCCVNGQFFECPDGVTGLQCLGEPIKMGQCIDACPQPDTNACQPACVAEHGPDPSGCARAEARDAECANSR
ncbi:MAG: hypothetical protein IT385_00105 [Deltaproteobacteria bacterium]|nr:hypothetical protein [Deltaproteobacteria bacterium]